MDMTEESTRSFVLRQSVTNTNLIFEDDASDRQFMSESVAYLIIRKPFISIDTGTNLAYGIVCGLKYNYTYWSDPTDTFAHSLQTGH